MPRGLYGNICLSALTNSHMFRTGYFALLLRFHSVARLFMPNSLEKYLH